MINGNSEDIRLAAERFIARYGEQAPDEARRRAAELSSAGHGDAASDWERIAELAEGLLARANPNGRPLH